ncbi:MAG: DNA adenine methylase [Leptospirales bacterium]
MKQVSIPMEDQFKYFPGSRYMGSKTKIVGEIGRALDKINFETFYDAFAGSNVVAYYMKCKGKQVFTNDFMSMSYSQSKALVENSNILLESNDIKFLITNQNDYSFITNNFHGLYFSKEENRFLENTRANIDLLDSEYKKSIALAALARACIKKRPRGIFTYVGDRYNDGRKDLKKTMETHFKENIDLFNAAVFDNGKKHVAYNQRTEELKVRADVVYLDPPYYTLNSDNDYVRRYHFVEGLINKWENVEIQKHTKTKKFKSYTSSFSVKVDAYNAFEKLIDCYRESIILISYSSNSLPTRDELVDLLKNFKTTVEVTEINHTYSFGNQNHKTGNVNNRVKEYLFLAY